MSSTQNIKEKEFTELRKRLNALGFSDSFNYESMDLVEKLLGNLMRISELYQKEKRKAEELNLRDKRVHYLTEP